jgi:hypothetical protein
MRSKLPLPCVQLGELGAPAQLCPFVVSPSYAFTYHLGEAG